jgi:hypothetical protein
MNSSETCIALLYFCSSMQAFRSFRHALILGSSSCSDIAIQVYEELIELRNNLNDYYSMGYLLGYSESGKSIFKFLESYQNDRRFSFVSGGILIGLINFKPKFISRLVRFCEELNQIDEFIEGALSFSLAAIYREGKEFKRVESLKEVIRSVSDKITLFKLLTLLENLYSYSRGEEDTHLIAVSKEFPELIKFVWDCISKIE